MNRKLIRQAGVFWNKTELNQQKAFVSPEQHLNLHGETKTIKLPVGWNGV